MTSSFSRQAVAVFAGVVSLLAVAAPASAHSAALDTSVSCPSTTPTGGFTDIGGLDATTTTAIDCLKTFGIVQGTTATTFTPDGTVTRWQMALFLVRQAAVQGITIPTAAPQGYADLGGLPSATQDAINQVTRLGIAKGSATTTFSPNDVVTRWQMALFLRRLAGLAGVSATDDSAHNTFSDIAAYTAEIQAAINFLADGHIALGTGGDLFSGNDPVVRWQMALFLTRVLAADVPAAPSPVLVSVAPGNAATFAIGDGRYFIATFQNADGTPYTGSVGILLLAVTGGAIEWDGAPAPTATFDFVSDALNVTGTLAEGNAGPDGAVLFRMRHTGGTPETVVAVAWQDLNDDNDPEIVGGVAPGEPYATGGLTSFDTGILPNCGGPTSGFAPITGVDTTANRIEAIGVCNVYYDSNDLFAIEGVPATMTAFEAAMNPGDEITGVFYDDNPFNQSSFDLSIDNAPGTVIIEMSAASNNTGFFGVLDVDDMILIDFSEDVVVTPGATIDLLDSDGTTATITCGVEATCSTGPGDQLFITITIPPTTSGGTSPDIENQAEISALGGITAADNGDPVNAADSSVLVRTFGGF